jgi:hypothetical protein
MDMVEAETTRIRGKRRRKAAAEERNRKQNIKRPKSPGSVDPPDSQFQSPSGVEEVVSSGGGQSRRCRVSLVPSIRSMRIVVCSQANGSYETGKKGQKKTPSIPSSSGYVM